MEADRISQVDFDVITSQGCQIGRFIFGGIIVGRFESKAAAIFIPNYLLKETCQFLTSAEIDYVTEKIMTSDLGEQCTNRDIDNCNQNINACIDALNKFLKKKLADA